MNCNMYWNQHVLLNFTLELYLIKHVHCVDVHVCTKGTLAHHSAFCYIFITFEIILRVEG
jgi:hypothetical protein